MTSRVQSSTLARSGSLFAAVAAFGLVAGACSSGDSDTDPTTEAATSAAETGEATGGSDYKNGEYSATGTYLTPGGQQKIGVTVTLSNSVVTALQLDTSETRGTSLEFQEKFASGIDQLVVGKNIDDLTVTKVAGSSLTSDGFNAAIEVIKGEAQG